MPNPSVDNWQQQQHPTNQSNLFHHNSNSNFNPSALNVAANPQQQQIFQTNSSNNNQQTQPSLTETNYSILSVGHGSFLKVYHSNHENAANLQQQSAQLQQQQIQPQSHQQTFNSYELFSSNTNSLLQSPMHLIDSQLNDSNSNQFHQSNIKKNQENENNTTNMIINQLVTNLSGTYKPFGSSNGEIPLSSNQALHQQHQQPIAQPKLQNAEKSLYQEFSTKKANDVQLPINSGIHLNSIQITNGNFDKIPTNIINPEVKKQRIVAEVKPMLYSDVLIKIVNDNSKTSAATSLQNNTSNSNSIGNNKNMLQNSINLESQSLKSKSTASKIGSVNKISSLDDKLDIKINNKKIENSAAKSDDLFQQSLGNNLKNKSRNDDPAVDSKKKYNKKLNNENILTGIQNKNSKKTQNVSDKKRNSRSAEDEINIKMNQNHSKHNNDGFYIATAKLVEDKPQKIFQNNTAANSNNNALKKSRGKTAPVNPINTISSKNDRQTKRGQKRRKDIKYELIAKFVEKWFEYTLKILTWLFYLIYDVVVLSFGIFLDRSKLYAANTYVFIQIMLKDFKKNSGKPKAWLKDIWKKFDQCFKKNSKWAFWRYFTGPASKKKTTDADVNTDFYKNGRLPSTGDEAMYSLLNCKGKDAYSILGVKADTSQEQIRKHYKKIAVLVHPDKNKQPGAEEAFKVLQRAFELIGEPENRKQYDQSVIEALNAEKAWSELNDLLSQLQTKISEAANTIRCSSCGLRHPRKLMNDRPHYAARECTSCKIRHSAREGDIWAETSFFGLRWKYLALMEGKCYDISEWAYCQKGALSHLQPNSHIVQYRIVRGGQQQQQPNPNIEKEKFKREPPSEPSLDDFLDNLYSGQNPSNHQTTNNPRRRSRRN